jgi:hypothetical protein
LLLSKRIRQVFDAETGSMESIEAATVGDKPGPLLLEHLPHRLLGTFGMRLGVGDTLHLSMSQAFS